MLQTLDLAKENALLRDEVSRLRGKVHGLARASEPSPAGLSRGPWPPATDAQAHALHRDGETCAPLVLIVPRDRTQDYELIADRFAGVPSCEVVVDRRNVERRRRQTTPTVERRRTERRCREREGAAVALVVSDGSDRAR